VFGTVISTATGLFDQRFLRNSFFLAFAFVALCAVVAGAGLGELGDWLATVTAWDVTAQLLAAVGLVGVVWFLAAILESQTRTITQVFEGYWTGPLTPLRKARENVHAKRQKPLKEGGLMAELYFRYPISSKKVMATRLGNVLSASEEYPHARYGADALLVWPRLYPLLPEAVVTLVAQSRGALEFLLVLSTLAATFALASGAYLQVVSGPVALYVACVLGGSLVAATAYRASLAAAEQYAEIVRSAFDSYRFDVLTAMHLPLPDDRARERAQWTAINMLIEQNKPIAGEYDHPEPPPAAP
jgi:hypothetical protein